MAGMNVPFTVRIPGDEPGVAHLVFAASYPYLLVGPAAGAQRLRWVLAESCELGDVLFDRPWHAVFTSPAPSRAAADDGAHEGGA